MGTGLDRYNAIITPALVPMMTALGVVTIDVMCGLDNLCCLTIEL